MKQHFMHYVARIKGVGMNQLYTAPKGTPERLDEQIQMEGEYYEDYLRHLEYKKINNVKPKNHTVFGKIKSRVGGVRNYKDGEWTVVSHTVEYELYKLDSSESTCPYEMYGSNIMEFERKRGNKRYVTHLEVQDMNFIFEPNQDIRELIDLMDQE